MEIAVMWRKSGRHWLAAGRKASASLAYGQQDLNGKDRLRKGFCALLGMGLLLWLAAPAGHVVAGAAPRPFTVLALGDSLTAGYGLAADEALPAQLERRLKERGVDVRVLNAGVSGDTSAGGRARLGWLLSERPDAVLVALGANDALRAIDPAVTRANLDAILSELKTRGIAVLFAGMQAPPNLGRAYGEAFNALFPELARRHGVDFYPFLLDGVAARPELNLGDGVHPNAKGVARMVDGLAPLVQRLAPAR
jgi:acyl-CoA thioesterase-1